MVGYVGRQATQTQTHHKATPRLLHQIRATLQARRSGQIKRNGRTITKTAFPAVNIPSNAGALNRRLGGRCGDTRDRADPDIHTT